MWLRKEIQEVLRTSLSAVTAVFTGCLRQEIKAGIDPIQKRIADKRERLAKNAEQVKPTTFEQCAEAYYKIHHKGWKNEKHRRQWLSTMRDNVYPVIGNLNG